jgi:RNA polymerase sigma-70 factor (ECF subfamily)
MENTSWESAHEEVRLVLAAQEGSLSAFDALVRRYRRGAIVVAGQILRSPELAEDAVQDSLLAAYKALPQLKNPANFASWLGAIVRHRAKRSTSDPHHRHLPIDELILAHAPAIANSSAPLDEVEVSETHSTIRCAVRTLPEEVQACIGLYYFDNWPVRKISNFLGLPATTVKWRLNIGRKQLRIRLEPQMEELK